MGNRLLILTILVLISISFSVHAGTDQVITTRSETSVPAVGSYYNAVMGMPNSPWTTTLEDVEQILPTRGTFYDFQFNLPTCPSCAGGPPNTRYRFYVIKNGVRQNASSFCQIIGSSTTCTGDGNFFFDKGDRIAIEAERLSNSAASEVSMTVKWRSSKKKETILMGGFADSPLSSLTTIYAPLHGVQNTPAADLNRVETLMPLDGNITDFYAAWTNGPTTSFDYNVTVLKNGEETIISKIGCATDTNSIQNFTCKVVGERVSITAGDTIVLQWQKPSGAVDSILGTGLVFEPDEDGNFVVANSISQRIPNSLIQATRYRYNTSGDGLHNALESEARAVSHAFTATSIFTKISDWAVTDANWTLTQRLNQSDTGLNCTVRTTDGLTCNTQAQLAVCNDCNIDHKIHLDTVAFLSDDPRMVSSIAGSLPVLNHACDYELGQGDLNILCSNNCTVVQDIDLDGNNLYFSDATGSGRVFVSKDINGVNSSQQDFGCTVYEEGGVINYD